MVALQSPKMLAFFALGRFQRLPAHPAAEPILEVRNSCTRYMIKLGNPIASDHFLRLQDPNGLRDMSQTVRLNPESPLRNDRLYVPSSITCV